jgi:hypothetical protein
MDVEGRLAEVAAAERAREDGHGAERARPRLLALSLSTLALSVAVIGYAIYVAIDGAARFAIPYAMSGAVSLIATWIENWQFAGRFEAVRALRLEPESKRHD